MPARHTVKSTGLPTCRHTHTGGTAQIHPHDVDGAFCRKCTVQPHLIPPAVAGRVYKPGDVVHPHSPHRASPDHSRQPSKRKEYCKHCHYMPRVCTLDELVEWLLIKVSCVSPRAHTLQRCLHNSTRASKPHRQLLEQRVLHLSKASTRDTKQVHHALMPYTWLELLLARRMAAAFADGAGQEAYPIVQKPAHVGPPEALVG